VSPAEVASVSTNVSLVPPSDGMPIILPRMSCGVATGRSEDDRTRSVDCWDGCATALTGAPRSPAATIISVSPTRVISALPAMTVWIAWALPRVTWNWTSRPSAAK
jgi:hypothetical protein